MQKNELLKSGDSILRILEIQEKYVLAIDCIRKSMPKWLSKAECAAYMNCCTEQELLTATGKNLRCYEDLDQKWHRLWNWSPKAYMMALLMKKADRRECQKAWCIGNWGCWNIRYGTTV